MLIGDDLHYIVYIVIELTSTSRCIYKVFTYFCTPTYTTKMKSFAPFSKRFWVRPSLAPDQLFGQDAILSMQPQIVLYKI